MRLRPSLLLEETNLYRPLSTVLIPLRVITVYRVKWEGGTRVTCFQIVSPELALNQVIQQIRIKDTSAAIETVYYNKISFLSDAYFLT